MDSSKDLIEGMKPLKYMYAHYSKKPFIDPRLRNPPMTTSKHLPIKSKLPSLTVNLANLSPILSNYTYQWGLCPHHPSTDTPFSFSGLPSIPLLLLSCTTVCFQQILPVNLKYLSCHESLPLPTIRSSIPFWILKHVIRIFYAVHLYLFYTVLYKAWKKISKHKTHLFFFNYVRYISKYYAPYVFLQPL